MEELTVQKLTTSTSIRQERKECTQEEQHARSTSFTSRSSDVEETIRTRNQQSNYNNNCAARNRTSVVSVFDVFAGEIPRPPVVVPATVSALFDVVPADVPVSSMAAEEPVVILDGMHKLRERSATSYSVEFEDAMDSNNSIGAAPPLRSIASRHNHYNNHHLPHEPPSMQDLAVLMREQDADLLESMQLKAANDDRMIVGSIGCSAIAQLPTHTNKPMRTQEQAAALENDGGSSSGAMSTAVVDAMGSAGPENMLSKHASLNNSRHRSAKSTSLRTLLLRHECGGGSGISGGDGGGLGSVNERRSDNGVMMDDHMSVATDGERSARVALSGEIWVMPPEEFAADPAFSSINATHTLTGSFELEGDNEASVPIPFLKADDLPISVIVGGENDASSNPAALFNPPPRRQSSLSLSPPQGRGIVRSESYDRRLHEAAQFAEAVGGDLQPNEQDEFRIIEEDGDAEAYDTDEDDDATEIHVEGLGNMPRKSAELLGLPDEVRIIEIRKVRPDWPFRSKRTKGGFLDKLPEHGGTQDFVYKGIRSNPPEIVSRGVTRGNYSCLHRKAWLECTDKYHRYGKNLRRYYRYWERLGFPTNMFFDWLDSKGEAAGQTLPELEECPRSQLDCDTVLYITDEGETRGFALEIVVDEDGVSRVVDVDNELVKTGPDGWIFVLRDNVMYGAQKITSVKGQCKQRFHHSSFFGGKAVASAGILITNDNGVLQQVLPHSGHYRPGEAHMQRILFYLHNQGVDLWSFQVDMQQMLHVARDTEGTEKVEKKKKTETMRLIPAGLVACYLAHKARFVGEGIFSQIHRIKRADVATVSEALELIDDGSRASAKEADTSHETYMQTA